MKTTLATTLMLLTAFTSVKAQQCDTFPDGTPLEPWYTENRATPLSEMGPLVRLNDEGVLSDSTLVQTAAIQKAIDKAAALGGTVVIPRGTYLSGALFFRPGSKLYLEEGAKLKGSSDISDFPVVTTRIEGQSCKYFAALINSDSNDGFKICGRGVIDGNGLPYWKAFWLRRSWNPQCTNKDEQRPRLVYLSNCRNAEISGVTLQNSPFWTTHLYRCDHVKLLGLHILSPAEPVKAPSTDAIDIDACTHIHVKDCYMAVNDDAIALKGGKGPWADQSLDNGKNEFIVIEDCEYGFCHGCITFGSESLHSRNVILRRIKVNKAARLLWLKMRPDTPQRYEYVRVEDISGSVTHFIYVKPWTQFFDLQGRTDMPMSWGDHITMQNIRMECRNFFEVERSSQYRLSNFVFRNLDLQAEKAACDPSQVDNFVLDNVKVNGNLVSATK